MTAEERKEIARAKRREYYRTHKEQMAAANKRWQQSHREHLRAYQKAYREAHPEKVRAWRDNSLRSWFEKKLEAANAQEGKANGQKTADE